MTRQQKNNAIENLKEALGGVKNLYLADIAGLDASQTSALRRACFKENINRFNFNYINIFFSQRISKLVENYKF